MSNEFAIICVSIIKLNTGFPGDPVLKNLPANAKDTGNVGSISGSGRSPQVGNGNTFQYSCLENSTDRGAWLPMAHGVTKSWTRVSTHTYWTCRSLIFSIRNKTTSSILLDKCLYNVMYNILWLHFQIWFTEIHNIAEIIKKKKKNAWKTLSSWLSLSKIDSSYSPVSSLEGNLTFHSCWC